MRSGRAVEMSGSVVCRAHHSQHQGRLAEPVCARPPTRGPQGASLAAAALSLRLREDSPLGKHARFRVPWGGMAHDEWSMGSTWVPCQVWDS